MAGYRWRGLSLLLSILCLIPALVGLGLSENGEKALSIDEICRKTTLTAKKVLALSDEDEDPEDDDASYIVIANHGELAYEIEQLFLSEDEDYLRNLPIRNVKLGPGERYRLEISGDDSLNIRKSGGTIVYLSSAKGTILDAITVPALERDEIYTKVNQEWLVMLRPDLKLAAEDINPPEFSAVSGFYEEPFDLMLSAEDGMSIYYTTDGSMPTKESPIYQTPIHVYDRSEEENVYRAIPNVVKEYETSFKTPRTVDKAFVIRAICVNAEGETSEAETRTYFVNLEKYKDRDVISLVADPEDLFGKNGIYVTGPDYDAWYAEKLKYEEKNEGEYEVEEPSANFVRRGIAWERDANFQYFRDETEQVNQKVGIRIQGGSHRNVALKRFSIYARKVYGGSKWFDFDIYETGVPIHSVVLREGFMNAFSHVLVEDREVSIQQSLPVTVFLNGEFWYNTYIQTKYNEKYFSEKYRLSDDNIMIMKSGAGEVERYEYKKTITDFIAQHDLSNEADYKEFCQLINVQSYIDYSAIQIYLGNADVSETKNYLLWKTMVQEDDTWGNTAWNWALYDMDLLTSYSIGLYGYETDAEYNTFADGGKWVGEKAYNQGSIWIALKESPRFCRQFVLTFMDLVNENFSTENVSRLMDEWGEYTIESYDNAFFLNRASFIVPYMAKEFGLMGTLEEVTLSANRSGKMVRLNTIQPDLTAGSRWAGSYYTDYPLTVTADDSGFLRWEITADGVTREYAETTIEVPVEKGGVQIHAVFE